MMAFQYTACEPSWADDEVDMYDEVQDDDTPIAPNPPALLRVPSPEPERSHNHNRHIAPSSNTAPQRSTFQQYQQQQHSSTLGSPTSANSNRFQLSLKHNGRGSSTPASPQSQSSPKRGGVLSQSSPGKGVFGRVGTHGGYTPQSQQSTKARQSMLGLNVTQVTRVGDKITSRQLGTGKLGVTGVQLTSPTTAPNPQTQITTPTSQQHVSNTQQANVNFNSAGVQSTAPPQQQTARVSAMSLEDRVKYLTTVTENQTMRMEKYERQNERLDHRIRELRKQMAQLLQRSLNLERGAGPVAPVVQAEGKLLRITDAKSPTTPHTPSSLYSPFTNTKLNAKATPFLPQQLEEIELEDLSEEDTTL